MMFRPVVIPTAKIPKLIPCGRLTIKKMKVTTANIKVIDDSIGDSKFDRFLIKIFQSNLRFS